MDLDAFDLSDADDDELMAVERIVWGVKRLVYNLTNRGPEALTCHFPDTDFDNHALKAIYEKPDPAVFVSNDEPISNYEPIAKRAYAKCHNAKKAKSNCLHCHSYHIGEFALAQGGSR